jgi:hypothetical protein
MFKSKDLICHLATFINVEDLPNFFLVAKIFNDNTGKNYHFWYKKLLRDFNFSYDSIYELSIIQQHYRILHHLKMNGISITYMCSFIFRELEFVNLRKYLMKNIEKFSLRCENLVGKSTKMKCNDRCNRYGKHILCRPCARKLHIIDDY